MSACRLTGSGAVASAELDDGNPVLVGYRKPVAWLVDGDPGGSGERLVPDNRAVCLPGVQAGPRARHLRGVAQDQLVEALSAWHRWAMFRRRESREFVWA